MTKSVVRNTWFHLTRQSRADVCFFSVGIANQFIDGKWFNRLSDHFALSCQASTLTVEEHHEWKWQFPRHNARVISHAPRQSVNTAIATLSVRDEHRRQAAELVRALSERCQKYLDWTLDLTREAWLIKTLAGRTAAMPWQYQAYQRMLRRIRPTLLFVEAAAYGGPLATLIAAARGIGITTAEFQHGSISAGHDAYNFAPAVLESKALSSVLPDYFLGYGQWWNDQINLPAQKLVIGNPHRDAQLAKIDTLKTAKNELLILSDGMNFEIYLELAKQLEARALARGLKIILRPHPIEQSAVAAKYGRGSGGISIERQDDFYEALARADTIVSEISTGLFEAIGIARKIYLWETPKSLFTYPAHPFDRFSQASDIADFGDNTASTSAAGVAPYWALDWAGNFHKFLEGLGVQ